MLLERSSLVIMVKRRRTEVLYFFFVLFAVTIFTISNNAQNNATTRCPVIKTYTINRNAFNSSNSMQLHNNLPNFHNNQGNVNSNAANSQLIADAKETADETEDSIPDSDYLIQAQIKAPPDGLCTNIERPKENQLPKYKDVYHYISHFKNDSRAYFLNTYYDNRMPSYEDTIIRTVTTSDFDLTETGIFATFWYPGLSIGVSVKCQVAAGPGPAGPNAWYYGFKRYTFLCGIPRAWAAAPPEKVSFSVKKCAQPMNYIDVVTPLPKNKRQPYMIGNCMQSLYGEFDKEFALMFVNWMETINMYGVTEVTVNLNNFTNSALGRKIFEYYEKKGILKITSYPDIIPPDTTLREQTVGRIQSFIQLAFVDCFFKNMHRYWYFLPLDVDELFVLNGRFKTYQDFLLYVLRKDPVAKNSIFLTGHLAGYYLNYMPEKMTVPEHLPLFRYTKRDRLRIGGHKKSFQNPRTCLFAGYHACRPLSQADQACEQCGYRPKVLPPDEMVLNHYRHSCKRNDGCLQPHEAITDDALFKQDSGRVIHKRVTDMLNSIGYFKS